jgi:hypothetical protein
MNLAKSTNPSDNHHLSRLNFRIIHRYLRAQVLSDTRLNRLKLLAELTPNLVFQSLALRALHQSRTLKNRAGTHELSMRLLACCNASMNQRAGANFCRASEQLLQHPANSAENDVVVAHQFGFAQAGGESVDGDVKLREGVVAGDVADCKNFEKFADIVSVRHAGFLGVVEGVEDVGRFALGELYAVSGCYGQCLAAESGVLTLVM